MLTYLPWKHQKNRVYSCNISDSLELNDIHTIREWVISQFPTKETSTHWWYNELPVNISDSFSNITKCDIITNMFKSETGDNYNIDILNEMNEIYISAPTNEYNLNETSDNIFYTRHIDGPFYYIPFASCYRLIIGLDDNREISTNFNLIPEVHTLKKGDVVAFDFHRECHYITKNVLEPINEDFRVVLKIHYCIYPRWAFYIGKLLGLLTILYNKNFRNLFLYTITTNTVYDKIVVKSMILTTKIVHDIEFYIGYNNISYLCLLTLLSLKTNYYIFLFGSSFIHYFRMIDSISNNCYNLVLKRDYRLYNFIHIIQLISMSYSNNRFSYITYYLILVLYTVSINHLLSFIRFGLLISLYDNLHLLSYNNLYVYSHLLLSLNECYYKIST